MCDVAESFYGALSRSTCLNPLGLYPLLGMWDKYSQSYAEQTLYRATFDINGNTII